ncbi:hypothetical protein VTO42DRAFT_6067 [Malbranchea cinnamomea]
MQTPRHLLTFVLFSYIVLASPLPPEKQARSFKVPRVRRSGYVLDGPVALKQAYAKFGILPNPIHHDDSDFILLPAGSGRDILSKTPEINENGAVTNSPTENDAQYLSPVTIGGQEFIMNLDTGSSDTWVFNTKLDESVTAGHAVFDPTNSTTFSELEGFYFNITYGDGSFASGTVGVDTVDIGGATAEEQAIGLPEIVSQSIATDLESDGLVGLGFTKLNTMRPEQQKTFFDNIADKLEEPVFTAQLKAGEPGSYEFGRIDKTKYTGELVEVPVNATGGFWEIQSSMYVVGENGAIQTVSCGVNSAIVDTGTTLMLVNEEIAEAYYESVPRAQFSPRAGGYIFPCDTTLPTFFVSVGDTHLVRIPGKLVNFALVGMDRSTGARLCFGGIQSNMGARIQVWGDVFLKAIFTVFDRRGPSLKFAGHA